MHVHSSGWSTTFTRLHVGPMLFADPDCRNIQRLLLSLREALRAPKSLENSPFLHGLLPTFIQGDLPGKVLKPISISQTFRKGCSLYKRSTPLQVPTQNRSCTTLSSCGTGTGSAHSNFASQVYVATRPCTCTAPDGQLRIHAYM